MPKLKEIVLTEEKKPSVVADVQALLDREVKSKRGVSGTFVKAGYKMVKTFKGGFLTRVISDLLPEFCDALEPLHERWREDRSGTFGDTMKAHRDEVTAALLSVTDEKAEQSTNRVVKKTYYKLRPSAERNVDESVPGLAGLMDEYYEEPEGTTESAESEEAAES